MNFQEKVLEVAADLRVRSLAFANAAFEAGRVRAQDAAKRAAVLQGSLETLGQTFEVSGRELNKVVRRHAARFVKENTTIARAAGKDFSAIARDTYANFSKSGVKKQASPTRKSATSRKRTRAKISG